MLLKDEKNVGKDMGRWLDLEIRQLKHAQVQLDWSNVIAGQQGRGEGGAFVLQHGMGQQGQV